MGYMVVTISKHGLITWLSGAGKRIGFSREVLQEKE
jgi:hypothetical protein